MVALLITYISDYFFFQIKIIGPHEILEARRVDHAQKTQCNAHHQCEVTYPAYPLYYQQSESESYPSLVQNITLQEESIHWNFNFAISLMAESLKLNSVYYYTFRNALVSQ